MPDQFQCPQCGSENVIFSKNRNIHVCEDCGHEFTPAETVVPLRIFLSYGHDANEELVRQIKADLETRGHDVWFDKSGVKELGITPGDDWRRAITDGILGSHRVVSFLSKHSTRDPGVCLDEIAIAIGVKGGNIQTILVESEQEVKPPATVSHIQWLDMHDWKERRASGEAAWEDWYREKFGEIVRVVESDESRRFAGEIETLSGHLKPISADTRISVLLRRGFVGRNWLFEAIENWRRVADRASRLFWIVGDPGVGKSAFAAHLTHFGRDKVIAAQFVEWDKPDHRDARRVVRSLAFQLATRLPDYRKLLLTLPEISDLARKDPAELFDYLLASPLRSVIHGGRGRYLIVIDALDEANEAGRNPLVELLARDAQRLPDWIGLVVTSRPESAVKTPLQGLNPFFLDTRTEANRADLRDYLRHELAAQVTDRSDASHLVEQILEKSEGVFLYVERFCEDIRHGYLFLDHPEEFPQGLGGKFFKDFQRYFPDLEKFRKDVRPALRAILAACEPLPVEILQRLFHWQDEELCDFTRPLGSIFPVTTEAGPEVIKPYHKSLADWLTDEAKAGVYFVSVLEGHRAMAEMFQREFDSNTLAATRYWGQHAPVHLYQTGRTKEAFSLLDDSRFKRLRHVLTAARYDVFISYARKDDAAGFITQLVERIKADFVAFSGRPLVSFELHPMDDWRHCTLQGLHECRLLLACLSPAYFASEYCQWEFNQYVKHEIGHATLGDGVAPIYLVEVPGWTDVGFKERCATWVAELGRRQYLDLRPWFQAGVESLRDAAVRERIHQLTTQLWSRISRSERAEHSPGNVDAHNPHFTGRTTELRRLRETVALGKVGVLTAVNGLGSVGKTALAIEYAHAFADEYGGGRWQVRCEGKDDLRIAIAELAAPLALEFNEAEKEDVDRQFQRVLAELRRLANTHEPHRCLLLLDNVDEPRLLEPAQTQRLPAAEWLHVLATTRLGEADLYGTHKDRAFLAVDELPEDSAIELIQSYQPGGEFATKAEREAVREIVRLLGCFTLAVETVAIYLGQFTSDVTCEALLSQLQNNGLPFLQRVTGGRAAARLVLQLQGLREQEKVALSRTSLFPADHIPVEELRMVVAERFPEFGKNAEPGYPDPWKNLLRRLLDLRVIHCECAADSCEPPLVVRMNSFVHAIVKQYLRLE